MSRYEATLYLCLKMSGVMMGADEIVQWAEGTAFPLPRTKLSEAARTLETAGAIRRSGYPHRYAIRGDTKSSVRALEKYALESFGKAQKLERVQYGMRLRGARRNLETAIQEILPDMLDATHNVYPVNDKDAEDVTRAMWSRADREILLLAGSGDFLIDSKKLQRTLEVRSKDKELTIRAMLLGESKAGEGKQAKNRAARMFLEGVGAEIYSTEDRGLQMNVVDDKEVELFLRPQGGLPGRPLIVYTALPSVTRAMRDAFYVACLRAPECDGERRAKILQLIQIAP